MINLRAIRNSRSRTTRVASVAALLALVAAQAGCSSGSAAADAAVTQTPTPTGSPRQMHEAPLATYLVQVPDGASASPVDLTGTVAADARSLAGSGYARTSSEGYPGSGGTTVAVILVQFTSTGAARSTYMAEAAGATSRVGQPTIPDSLVYVDPGVDYAMDGLTVEGDVVIQVKIMPPAGSRASLPPQSASDVLVSQYNRLAFS
jgi:hypothetical protein